MGFTISTVRHLRVLLSPVRMEILEILQSSGPASARDLAERLGRTPESLYYHLKLLRGIGIVRIRGRRPGPRRDEAVFEATEPTIEMRTGPVDARFRQARASGASSIARLVERQLRAAVLAEKTIPPRAESTVHVDREVIRVTPRSLRELNRRLDELLAFCGRIDDPEGELTVALTVVQTPVEP